MLTIYKASAGSGKTYTLVGKYLLFLLSDGMLNTAHKHILAVTFTHKATNEMKARVLKDLFLLANEPKPEDIIDPKKEVSEHKANLLAALGVTEGELKERAQKCLCDLLQDYSNFAVNTIDSFFQQVLRAFVRELGMSGSYTVELDNDELMAQAIDNMFFELDDTTDEGKKLFDWLQQFTEENIHSAASWNPRREIDRLGKEIFKESYQSKLHKVGEILHDKVRLQQYKKDLKDVYDAFDEHLKTLGKKALKLIEQGGLEPKDFKKDTLGFFLNLPKKGIHAPTKTFKECARGERTCYTVKDKNQAAIQSILDSGLQTMMSEAVDFYERGIKLYNTSAMILKSINTVGILADVSSYVRRLSEEENLMPISDTTMLLNKVIGGSDAPFIYEKIGVRINHYMIDEFQDTSTMQWANFKPLIQNSLGTGHGNLIVGDVKQSIYRFRSSDWSLLHDKVPNDPQLKERIENNTLDDNWRSRRAVVEFNNELFGKASALVRDKIAGASGENELNAEKVNKAYEGHEQNVQKRDYEGYVQVEFVDKADEEWRDQILDTMLEQIQSLQQRHFGLHQIAVLARKTSEVQEITQFLLEKGIKVVSNEGLMVSRSAAVRFILGIMHLYMNPNDAIQQASVKYEYMRHVLLGKVQDGEALARALEGKHDTIFTPEQEERLKHIACLSLSNMVEQIIELFDIFNWEGEAIFVQGLLDAVFAFSGSRKVDLHSFFEWWAKKGTKLTVPMPETKDAIQVMTVHKSKGLEFNAVLIPFCEWKLDQSSQNKNIMWCEPKVAPFDALPLVAVPYTSKLADSIFHEEYYAEQLNYHVDNLNLLYVALTRPKMELYCQVPIKYRKQPTLDCVAQLMSDCLGSDVTYTKGTMSVIKEEDRDAAAGNVETQDADSGADMLTMETLIQSHKCNRISSRFVSTKPKPILTDTQQLGTVMHSILSEIHVRSDQEKAIANLISTGCINESQRPLIEAELNKFWAIEGVEQWFSPACRIINEAAILTTGGKIFRPDRVVIHPDGHAIVVDYKFTQSEKESYHEQVRNYKSLVEQMGYVTKAYLCYVHLGKVVEVA